ncbi:MAG: hypothetical protein Q8O37_14765 [Sulfuricellaceae bacterium]|nr:hypothetical protein [Sulfuricellaceae bacterium]
MTGIQPGVHYLSVLVFRVMGVRIGIDTDQIGGFVDVATVDKKKCKLVSMNELLGIEPPERPHSKVIFAKGGYVSEPSDSVWMRREQRLGVVVSDPEEIVEIPLEVMSPLPQLIHAYTGPNGLWAIALMSDEAVFLADIRKMIGNKAGDVMWVK